MEEPRKSPRHNVKKNSDVIVYISDDEPDVTEVRVEWRTEPVETALTEECVQTGQTKDEPGQEGGFHDNDTWFSFIRRYGRDNLSANTSDCSVPPIFSPTHRRDIVQACCHTPYCLYLYMGVELGGGRSTSVVLIGYVDQRSKLSVVRLLHTLQLSVDASPPNSADMDADAPSAESDVRLLIDTLEKSVLPLSNLVAFYCNAAQPAVSRLFESQLRVFSPRLVSLCGIPGIAGRACQAGLLASFCGVVDLIRDIHHHYSTCPSVNDSLKEVFAAAESYDPSRPVSAQCFFIVSAVQKMVCSWRDLVDYFRSLGRAADSERIRTQLMDHKVKLHFQFLCQILDPLRALDELQQSGTADVASELHLTSMLLRTYSASLLRPPTAERFLRNWDLSLLHSEKELLPPSETDVGSSARDFLWASAVVDLGEQDRTRFMKDAAVFYTAVLESLVKSIPQNLGEVALKNISRVLKHPENISVSRFLEPPPLRRRFSSCLQQRQLTPQWLCVK